MKFFEEESTLRCGKLSENSERHNSSYDSTYFPYRNNKTCDGRVH